MLQNILWIFAISLAVYSIPSSIVGFIGVFSCNQYADATVTQCGRNGQHSNYFNLVYDNMTCHYISDTTPCMPGNQVIRICYKLFHPTDCQSAINQYGSGAVLFSNPNIPKGILISGIVCFLRAFLPGLGSINTTWDNRSVSSSSISKQSRSKTW